MEGNGDRIRKPGGRRGNSYFLKNSTSICSQLNITEYLKSVSPRGKMIPAELERQIWQASKEVRWEKEGKEKVGMHLDIREGMQAARPVSVCGREKRAC